jgi:hypothetical protein
MGLNDFQRVGTLSVIPNLEELVMRRRKNMLILPVPFDLSSSSIPICEGIDRLCRPSEVPTMDIAIDSTGGEEVWMVGREVDIGNGSRVGMEGVLDRRPRTIVVEVPHQSFLVRSTNHPVVSGGERGPLHVCRWPLLLVCEMSRGGIGRVEVDDVQSFGAGDVSDALGIVIVIVEPRTMLEPRLYHWG